MTKSEIFKTVIRTVLNETVRVNTAFYEDKAEHAIKKYLHQTEIIVLGIGLYSIVVQHPEYPDRVFKVSTSRWDGFRAYAQYCIENEGNPFLPKIHSMNTQGDFSWYELDLLYDIALMDNSVSTELLEKQREQYNCVEDIFLAREKIAYNLLSSDCKLNEYSVLQNLIETCMDIRNRYVSTYEMDMHEYNVMQTTNGQMVITDALAKNLRHEIPMPEENPDL